MCFVRSFWKFVSKLDRRETRRYLQMFYTLMMRPLIAKVTNDGRHSAQCLADLLRACNSFRLQAAHCLTANDAAHRLRTCRACRKASAATEHLASIDAAQRLTTAALG